MISDRIMGLTEFLNNRLSTRSTVSSGGILGNKFCTSKETSLQFFGSSRFFKLFTSSSEFLMLKVELKLQYFSMIFIRNFDSLYAGEDKYETTGRTG